METSEDPRQVLIPNIAKTLSEQLRLNVHLILEDDLLLPFRASLFLLVSAQY